MLDNYFLPRCRIFPALILILLLSFVLLAGCASSSSTSTPPATASTPTLDEKIGQMLMVGFRGMEVDDTHFIVQDIQHRNLGGIILFDYDVISAERKRNIESPAQVKALIAQLQQKTATPLLVAVDQEGGIIARLKERYGFPPTRSHMDLGTEDDLRLTLTETTALATTLAEAGFNLNMAPVVDLCSNPNNPVIAALERCFSADPQQVTAHALSYIKAHHQREILTTLKHFPGHGSSQGDSHLGLTDVTNSWSELELLPYHNIIAAGQADLVMTAHVFNAHLDPDYPATLSRAVIDGILRQRLGFDGVVISDDMQMGAIVDYYGFETAIALAITAGVDILVFGNNLRYDENIVARAVATIKEQIHAGTLSEARIEQAYRRIMQLKSRLN
ncbi:MAG: glycoside hydrolase family 3 N-terminal domain-containing protein [Desulfuromonas sp.]|nr:glycoside hydrolase family 3 N-terminal domain-containing protein [Desulfuromonas sp.]